MAAVPEFDGKTAIVTGGARGLGRAITRMLVDRGATVAIIDLDEKTARTFALERKVEWTTDWR